MPLMGGKQHRGPKALLLLLLAAGGAVALSSGKDIKRYLRIRSM
ncbi:MAG TPA: hypothetical protein VG520_08970 [Candidatus Dormibacteraeota bacterium]|jgi:hypothetical protein|nr:hypothetical protein [Candidatus Dormibacteraeota bacterium]